MKKQISLPNMSKLNHLHEADRLVEQSLKAEPAFTLPENFAEKMAVCFEKRQAWQLYLREFLIYILAGIGLVGVVTGMFFFLMSELWIKLVAWVGSNIVGLVGFSAVLIFIVFTDRVLLRYFYLKTKRTP